MREADARRWCAGDRLLHQSCARLCDVGASSPYPRPSPKSLKTAYNDDQISCGGKSLPTRRFHPNKPISPLPRISCQVFAMTFAVARLLDQPRLRIRLLRLRLPRRRLLCHRPIAAVLERAKNRLHFGERSVSLSKPCRPIFWLKDRGHSVRDGEIKHWPAWSLE